DLIQKDPYYLKMIDEYLHLNRSHGEGAVDVFIGDSITKGFNICEFESKNMHPILNRGIDSDTTDGLLRRIDDNLNNLSIDKVFLLIGYNDIDQRSNGEIVSNIKKILSISKAKRKYVQSILPVSSRMDLKNSRILEINRSIAEMSKQEGYVFIDLHTYFGNESKSGINPSLTYDGMHLNYFGYKLWYDLIKNHLDEV
ncbi:MAG: hypothetical protein HZB37_02395, partial [Planctomycetes bacterium]|nr:hypothetical protein [Planctomycetota bacterium]